MTITSYLTHDGKQTTVEEDFALHERLLAAQPLHASPAEHQATPLKSNGAYIVNEETRYAYVAEHTSGNLVGWQQYRKTLEGEFVAG